MGVTFSALSASYGIQNTKFTKGWFNFKFHQVQEIEIISEGFETLKLKFLNNIILYICLLLVLWLIYENTCCRSKKFSGLKLEFLLNFHVFV